MLILDNSAKTDPKFGCNPKDRTLESLLDAGVILVDKPRGPSSHQLTAWARECWGYKDWAMEVLWILLLRAYLPCFAGKLQD